MPPVSIRAPRSLWPWVYLGLAGSVLVAVAGPQLAGGRVEWWFDPSLGGAGAAVLYAGIVALCIAWLALMRLAITTRQLWTVGAAWCLPLLFTAPLFSHDAYSYLAQGTLVRLGIDPYRHAPAVLAQAGQAHVLRAVDPFWRHTTAPYGPLFLRIVGGIAAITGSHLIARRPSDPAARRRRARAARGVRAATGAGARRGPGAGDLVGPQPAGAARAGGGVATTIS